MVLSLSDIIICFNVRPDAMAKQTADSESVDIRLYSVDIANNLDRVEAKFLGNSTVVPIGGKKVTFEKRIIVPIATKPSVQLLKFKRS